MQLDQLRSCLDSHAAAKNLLFDWDVRDFERGRSNLVQLADAIGLDALGELCHPWSRPALPTSCRPCLKGVRGHWRRCCSCSAPANSSATCLSPIRIFSTCCAS